MTLPAATSEFVMLYVKPRLFDVLCLIVALFVAPVRAADFIITEFQAVNGATLLDEDRDFSDWIEIHRTVDAPGSIDGWYLTDDAANLRKWKFPDTEVDGRGFLVVFASGKDRAEAGLELHTNFGLSRGGELLALAEPDGTTVASVFFPYPAQRADVSYGLNMIGHPALLLPGAPVRVHSPINRDLGTSWTAPDFDDETWARGTTGVGYERRPDRHFSSVIQMDVEEMVYSVNPTVYMRLPFTLAEAPAITQLRLRVKYADGFVAYLNGQRVA